MKRLIPLVATALLVLTGCGQNEQDNSTAAPSPTISYTDGMTATVVSVESANTFTAEINGAKKQVRLINVAAPSPNGLALSSDCLVDESKALLSEKLPANSQVTLKFDENQHGKTGYVEAAVYSGDAFINRDMARAGMVATTFTNANDKFYPDISQAQQEAANEGVGLYSRDIKCTIPAMIQEQKATVEDARGWEVNTADDAPAEDKQKVADREKVYRDASDFYRGLQEQVKSPAQWVGSIVTLDSVSKQLSDLEQLLGDDFYLENGVSANQQKKSGAQSTPARPGS